jgi:hypothetical protein
MVWEMVSETLGFYPQLTRLVAREDFINGKQVPLAVIASEHKSLRQTIRFETWEYLS